jgi:hypothetical protein
MFLETLVISSQPNGTSTQWAMTGSSPVKSHALAGAGSKPGLSYSVARGIDDTPVAGPVSWSTENIGFTKGEFTLNLNVESFEKMEPLPFEDSDW